jgi:hypothetical protein
MADNPDWRPPTREERIQAVAWAIQTWARIEGFGLPTAKKIFDRDTSLDDEMRAEAWKLSKHDEPSEV